MTDQRTGRTIDGDRTKDAKDRSRALRAARRQKRDAR